MSFYRGLLRRSRLYPVLALDEFFSPRQRRFLGRLGLLAAVLLAAGWIFNPRFIGLAFVVLALSLFGRLLNGYFHSFYFDSILTNQYQPRDLFTFTAGRIFRCVGRDDDLLRGFLCSATGRQVIWRCGITPSESQEFLQGRGRAAVPPIDLPQNDVLRLQSVAEHLLASDEKWRQFLLSREIRQEEFLAAVAWVVREIESEAAKERWWARENLERIGGLAKDWAYGGTFRLDRYSRDLLNEPEARSRTLGGIVHLEEVRKVESALMRSAEANALLLGPAGQSKMEVVWELARQMKSGRITPALEHKRLVLFQAALFAASAKDKNTFENELLKIFNEAVRAGNIILLIDNLVTLLAEADKWGSSLADLLDPFLASAALQVVALADIEAFHDKLEGRTDLLRRFEKIQIGEIRAESLLLSLEELASRLEKEYGVIFTYPAVKEAAQSAEQYFSLEETRDKAVDLLIEIAPWASLNGQQLVDRRLMLEFVGRKTGVPLGEISRTEQEKLLNLESRLAERIVGQRPAIAAVSNALRRSRAGIRNLKRPVGAFLFLGPTGVGKTETAKALAEVFFGSEDALRRLDMSEYRGPDALERLIGSFALRKTGILVKLLRQYPYGVALLDEFEKSHPDVHNLFLQIFDEGFFSDMLGRRVSGRNIIFIATSNAAAELIWEMVQKGRDPAAAKDELIDYLVKNGLFRPELLNRFDDIIIFHPLSEADLKQVALLLLKRLNRRLSEQGITLEVEENLIRAVVEQGSNKLFGARPMLRFIQDNLEQPIARGMIKGEIKSGARVAFAAAGGELKLLVPHA